MSILPKAFDPDDETNSKLGKFKLARVGKWSLGSSKSLGEMAKLATYLLALERYAEAAEIGEFVSRNVPFGGNYDIWSPASNVIAIGARSWRMLQAPDRADSVYRPIGEHPSYVINRALEEQIFRETPGALQDKIFLGVAQSNILRIEDARAGRPGTEWYPITEMENYLAQALTAIRKSLGLGRRRGKRGSLG